MNSKVRDLFRVETKDIVSFENFNQIYYVFEQMVLYDVDVPEIEGLRERLPYALNKVAVEKLDRNDIITFFPIIWGKFEPYARKLLYLVNPSKYKRIRSNKNSSVVNVLDELGIKVFVNELHRTNKTDAVFTVYQLRNSEAHECETWSIRKCYNMLAKALSAFLIVTNKALPDIQRAMEGVPEERRIRVPLLKHNLSVTVDILGDFRGSFYDLNMSTLPYYKIGDLEFDRNGWPVLMKYSCDDYTTIERFEYEYKKEKVVKSSIIKKTQYLKRDHESKEEIYRYSLYEYNDQNQIIMIRRFRKDTRSNQFFLRSIEEIEYLTDGGLIITKKDFIRKLDMIGDRKSQSEDETVHEQKRFYDSRGLLVRRTSGNNSFNYTYISNGVLSRIEYPDYSYDEIKHIGENEFIVRKKREDEFGHIVEKRLYIESRIKRIQYYDYEDHEGNKVDEPILKGETLIEYFDEK